MGRIIGGAIALLVGAATARAQPATTGGSTPTIVDPADPSMAMVLPALARTGNLRVSISCAETWVTPADGLVVTADGAVVSARRENGQWDAISDDDGTSDAWSATDTGYLLAPGRHHVEIDAPGCAPAVFDVDAFADHARVASGRLAVVDASLAGRVGAPNGIGVVLGVLSTPSPQQGTEPGFGAPSQSNAYDPGDSGTGGWLSVSFERRHFVLAFDQAFLQSTISGESTDSEGGMTVGPVPFTGHAYDWRSQLRLGARLPLDDVAISAGSGIAGDMWFLSSQIENVGNDAFLVAPDGVDASFYFPMWASVTIKPSCGWGFQLLGQYDVHPTSMETNGYELGAGFLFQPSDACSEPAGVHVGTD